MSEVRGDDQEYFRAIEALHMDPSFGRIIDNIRTYNEMLAEEPVDKNEVLSMRNDIDAQWYEAEVMNERVVFTGKLSILQDGLKSDSKYYEDKEYDFKGVEPVDDRARNLNINDDDTIRHYKLNLFMIRTLASGDLERVMANIEDIASLEFPDRMYPERAQHILQNYQPNLLKDIDASLVDPDADESMTAMRLEGLQYKHDDDESTAETVVMALKSYVGSKITFDTNIGYVVSLDGEVRTQEDKVLILEGQAAPAKVEGIEWRPGSSGRGIVPHFKLHISGERSTDDCVTLHVPLDSVSSIQSLRHKFWQDQSKNS